MKAGFKVLTTPSFERELKKLFKKNKEIFNIFYGIVEDLKNDPFNQDKARDIKKLTDVKPGEGQWRIHSGSYRFRYDVIKKDIILHSARDRKNSYK
jgi:mRNA-degrading endonuclease RelE of RelBE toxin-antitoxin system